ncbi:MAG: DUF2723 domain-containing protein [Phycisphaerales bacterium]|nr:DUF2723 domain-containing protein [Phycisphaerales bacterium]
MNRFTKFNTLVGWCVFAVVAFVYLKTAEAGISFWDCGEFVSCSYKLQVTHPPGAPLFLLLGRIFILMGGVLNSIFHFKAYNVAFAVNCMSALSGAFAAMFLFWVISFFASRLLNKEEAKLDNTDLLIVFGAGVIGSLAFSFGDTIWFSTVEGIVWSVSHFFSMLILWITLKWMRRAHEPNADRWLVLVFLIIGLSTAVHLYSLLMLPLVIMLYYFVRWRSFNYALLRKYFLRIVLIGGALAFILTLVLEQSAVNEDRGIGFDAVYSSLVFFGVVVAIGLLYWIERKKTKKEFYAGFYIFFLIASAFTGTVLVILMRYLVGFGGYVDILFVNDLQLPFFSGFISFFVVLILVFIWAIRYAIKKNYYHFYLVLCSTVALLLPFLICYSVILIRANAQPSINMAKADNPVALVSYLSREQYGEVPHIYGQTFAASPADYEEGSNRWEKGDHNYFVSGQSGHYVYRPEDKLVFSRIWDASNDQGHGDYYAYFLGYGKDRDGKYINPEDNSPANPTQSDNFRFFAGYQTYFMYLRYLLWNYSGREDDIEGLFVGSGRDGNWISGIPPIDNIFLGNQEFLPDSLKKDKAHTTLFLLPFILGILGFVFHFKKKPEDAWLILIFFFFMGMAECLYNNTPGYQPRERDYTYETSFAAFAVWIGLGIFAVRNWFQKSNYSFLTTIATVLLCFLLVPGRIISQEWASHDRSQKWLPGDIAKDYLNSCPPNAILFTFGDNDTYPLWYEQEVENVRPDIRIINYSLLGVDWYINQLRHKVNASDLIPMAFTQEQIQGSTRDYVVYQQSPKYQQNQYYNLYDVLHNYVGSNDESTQRNNNGEHLSTYPVKKFFIPVDRDIAIAHASANPDDSIQNQVSFECGKPYLLKNDLTLLSIIAANNWKRPICFSSPLDGFGLDPYMRQNGLTWQLVPVLNNSINTNFMYDQLMNNFRFGNANTPGVYFDETNRGMLNTLRSTYATLAKDLVAKGRLTEAKAVLEKADKGILEVNMPYGMTSRGNIHDRISLMFLQSCYLAGDTMLIAKVSKSVRKDLEQQRNYYNSLGEQRAEMMANDRQTVESLLQVLNELAKK